MLFTLIYCIYPLTESKYLYESFLAVRVEPTSILCLIEFMHCLRGILQIIFVVLVVYPEANILIVGYSIKEVKLKVGLIDFHLVFTKLKSKHTNALSVGKKASC